MASITITSYQELEALKAEQRRKDQYLLDDPDGSLKRESMQSWLDIHEAELNWMRTRKPRSLIEELNKHMTIFNRKAGKKCTKFVRLGREEMRILAMTTCGHADGFDFLKEAGITLQYSDVDSLLEVSDVMLH